MNSCSKSFDIVLLTLGSLWWIEDLPSAFAKIATNLVAGGKIIIFDFHPFSHSLAGDLTIQKDYPFECRMTYHHSGILPYALDEEGFRMPRLTSASRLSTIVNPFPVTDYKWSLQSIVEAIAGVGGKVDHLLEFPYVWGERYFDALIEKRPMEFSVPDGLPRIPLTMALAAVF
jgi:hypothetical protein